MSLYPALLDRVLLPSYDRIRGRQYIGRRRFLEASQWWSFERIRAFQWTAARKLLQHAFESVPYYRRKYSAAGIRLEDIRCLEDFRLLPPLSREEIRENTKELCSTTYRGKLLPHATGGSSGTPTRFFRTYESYDWRTAAKDRAYSWCGWRLGERSVYLWGAPVGKVSRFQAWKSRLHATVDRQLIFNTFSQTDELWHRIRRQATDFRPSLAVGYVSSLEQFAAFLKSTNQTIPGVRAVIAAAEPLFSGVRETIEDGFQAPVFNTYGSREFMSIAAECEYRGGMHVNAENLLVENKLQSRESPSEILVTDLHNYGMPFIRYEIGDLGLLCENTCDCGRGLPRLQAIEGRVLDALRTVEGRIVPGEFFPHLLKEIPEFRKYRVEQKTQDTLIITAVMSTELSRGSRELLEREVTKVFGTATRWTVERVETIPALPSGKRRVTIGLPAALRS